MLHRGLKISWYDSTEYIPIDPVNPEADDSISWTIERWQASGRGGKTTWVSYVVTSTIDRMGDEIELRLRYRQADQIDERLQAAEYWGESVIKWRPAEKFGKAYWTDDVNHDADGEVDVEIIHPPKGRGRENVNRNARPEQGNLRDALLAMDGACAISGETTPEALQAAHIRPVADDGVECPANAILLRADLHLLFDAKLLSLNKTDKGVVVQCAGISEAYEAFDGVRLRETIVQRIAHQLPRK